CPQHAAMSLLPPPHSASPLCDTVVLVTPGFVKAVTATTYGAKMPRASWDDIGDLCVPVPPPDEQADLVAFLDRETANIDALIEKQHALNERLREQQRCLMIRAVTKGFRTTPRTQESGVPWIGAIPAHWSTCKVRHIATVVRGASPRPAGNPEFFGGDFCPWITVAEVTKDDQKELFNTTEYLTQAGVKASRMVSCDTLLLTNSGATLGVPKIIRIQGCINDGSVALLNLNKKIDKDFLYWVLKASTTYIREFYGQGQGQPNLNTDLVRSFTIPVPPKSEQIAIVSELESRLQKLTTVRETSEAIADQLNERRRALITAAVTGQIESRSARLRQAAE
ncbi:restriction endonuclease subunit S, partial [Falsiroseomonas tokyonensis]